MLPVQSGHQFVTVLILLLKVASTSSTLSCPLPNSKDLDIIQNYKRQRIADLVVWYLASGAQGPWINTWLGLSRLGLDKFGFLTNS